MKQQHKLSLSLALVLLILLSLVVIVSAGNRITLASDFAAPRDSAAAAVTWLYQENQNNDGGFGIDFGTGDPLSNIPSSVDATLAISALGYNPDLPSFGAEKSVMDYLEDNAADLVTFAATNGGSNGKVILALAAAKDNARNFAGHDYVAQLQGQYDAASGSYNDKDGKTPFNQGLAIVALAAVGEPVPPKALEWLEDLQASDGSWSDGFGTLQNPDATAMAIMGLLAGGRDVSAPPIQAALGFLAGSQLDSGGWEYDPESEFGENANSTALVVQALAATGENFYESDGPWAKNGASPLMVLLSWQNETGAYQADFGQGRFDNFFATVQSLPASLGKPYPFQTYLLMMPIVSGE